MIGNEPKLLALKETADEISIGPGYEPSHPSSQFVLYLQRYTIRIGNKIAIEPRKYIAVEKGCDCFTLATNVSHNPKRAP